MSAVNLQSQALLNSPNIEKQWLTMTDIVPVINDIKNINTNNAGEASLGANTFTGVQTVSNTTDSTSGITGSINTLGGLGVTKKVFVADTTDSTTKDTGSIITEGGIGVEKAIFAGTSITATTRMFTGAGIVTAPGMVVGANDNGFYEVSSTQMGASIGNALVGGWNASGLFTGIVSEQVATAGVAVDSTLLKDGLVFNKTTPVAIDVTATATAAEMVSGYITSTSAAAVAITTPTATAIAALIGAVRGTYFDLVIDNSAGANTVTLTLDASIAVVTPAITGGDTLTVSTANAIGIFRIVFTSGTTAKIFRIA